MASDPEPQIVSSHAAQPSRSGDAPLVVAKGLKKTFRIGFMMRRVEAVRDASFDVRRGEILGLVGPNGAGKTTTIKLLLGLIRPDAGEAMVDGISIRQRAARRRVAYLPETPHFYDYLKPAELLGYFGDLYGMDSEAKRRRIPELLDRVGLGKALDKPLRKFSKGMLQRVGLAQALLPDAQLVILDEPQSGLDPIGRRDVRDLILEARAEGKTILMSSHVLPDVEQICDRVVIMHMGRVVRQGRIDDIVDAASDAVEVVVRASSEVAPALSKLASAAERTADGGLRLTVPDASGVDAVLRAALDNGATVVSVEPHRANLEDVFTSHALRTDAPEDDR